MALDYSGIRPLGRYRRTRPIRVMDWSHQIPDTRLFNLDDCVSGGMSSITVQEKSAAVAFSFLAGWTIGWGEVIAAIVVQHIVADHDLDVAFCESGFVPRSIVH